MDGLFADWTAIKSPCGSAICDALDLFSRFVTEAEITRQNIYLNQKKELAMGEMRRFLRRVTMRALGCLLATGAAALVYQQQSVAESAQAVPKFEVVSIKPCKAGTGSVSGAHGKLRLECATADGLIRDAYLSYASGAPRQIDAKAGTLIFPLSPGLMRQPMKGSSGWVQSERFTIDAKAESPVNVEMMRGPMMRVLLKERFNLQLHREATEVQVYELIVEKGGPRLQSWKEGDCTPQRADLYPAARKPGQPVPLPMCGGMVRAGNNGVEAKGVTLAHFCSLLSIFSVDRPVVDKTGIAGLFDIHLDMSYEELLPKGFGMGGGGSTIGDSPAQASDPGGSLFDAVRKLGLKLQPAKMRLELPVIDRIERPTSN
jgi:uncharacterized protein (TIGR03435 family)